MFELLVIVLLLIVGYWAGTAVERRHFASIRERERRFRELAVLPNRKLDLDNAHSAALVTGSAVIAIDYFKMIAASLRNIVGGHVSSLETLIDRARREAILRMKAEAHAMGAEMVVGFRLETSNIGSASSQKSVVAIEALAYGTAVRRTASPASSAAA